MVQLLRMIWLDPTVVVIDMFDTATGNMYTETWSTDPAGDNCHQLVLDRAGAGRLLAGIGAALGSHPEPPDDEDADF